MYINVYPTNTAEETSLLAAPTDVQQVHSGRLSNILIHPTCSQLKDLKKK